MADLASLTISPKTARLAASETQAFAVSAAGELLLQNNAAFTWQNLDDCVAIYTTGLKDDETGASEYGIAGATNSAAITAGDGFVEFVATAPFADPATGAATFGGRLFFCGLTRNASVNEPVDFDFAFEVYEGGVSVFEGGVNKGVVRAAQNNGHYYVGIEGGVVIYRINGEIVYRSDGTVVYPVRGGAAFVNRSVDFIGGTANVAYTLAGYDESGAAAGVVGGLNWTAPAERGTYRVVASNAQYLYDSALIEVARTFPSHFNTNGFPVPSVFYQVRAVEDFRVNAQINEDLSGTYKIPTPATEQLRRWVLEFGNLSQENAKVLDDFFDEHAGLGHWFYLYDWRADAGAGVTWDNVRIERYESPRNYRKVYSQARRFQLFRRPL